MKLFLICSVCPVKHTRYRTSRTKQEKDKKLVLRKYCRNCRTTQIHKEEIIK